METARTARAASWIASAGPRPGGAGQPRVHRRSGVAILAFFLLSGDCAYLTYKASAARPLLCPSHPRKACTQSPSAPLRKAGVGNARIKNFRFLRAPKRLSDTSAAGCSQGQVPVGGSGQELMNQRLCHSVATLLLYFGSGTVVRDHLRPPWQGPGAPPPLPPFPHYLSSS